ncbi:MULTISPECIES: methyltransferase domain-containing protein [unclassified Tolypothrix]|uniref:methyltransferase domain-containing protein n=1 Tax=unclassified Tolypothrix TaxID=2649714 RepID=UPI0005EAC7B7|nr:MULTISPECIES: methyltransferase domain-containing protein [unclassified Tolypothrix]BAY91899.1 cyclopropane-fatty-acyl-phospholipid synthase [Microchaete diplosiphon NIES-3275]EKF04931.1 SAM-dependent methyltransferase [Tolypothrix sp. PCC 7601]MBE9087239.1 methyltransferase domain-containing protein [Tolypothrix sp. LEGE 11397]UYD25901.1 methyltransferase domain-containing protein [Tolypothrix sp. PCC 7712]UYD31860.1 methyltransferase domain-containing protein [Tolypothrix sp. PCC 7601]
MSTTLYQQIQQFYDASSGLWEEIWGEHMHHGYYGPDGTEKKDRRQAQIDLIEELLHWAEVETAENILDVGCGIGGSSLYLAEKFHAKATGITLSPVQANRATERAQKLNLSDRSQFLVADAQEMPFADNSFDLVWSLESGEHMPNKIKFLQECYRVLKPGGKLIMVTWCHRPIDNAPLTDDERKHLHDIYRVYCLPYVISLPEYAAIANQISLKNVRTADWSKAVAPFWDFVIDSAFTPKAIWGLLTAGWTTIVGALSLGLMSRGYQSGLIRFGLLCGDK